MMKENDSFFSEKAGEFIMRISVFDIGGTFIKHSIFNGFELSERKLIPTEAHRGSQDLIDRLARMIKAEEKEGQVDGVGISTRGQVDFLHGVIIFDPPTVFPDYSGTKLREQLRDRLQSPDLPVIVENDGNCAALAESIFGAAQNYDDSLCVVFGTSIGGAIVQGKQIYHGCRFSAGEFGMMCFPDGNGNTILYEEYASVTALVNMVSAMDSSMTSGRRITEALAQGNAEVSHLVDIWCKRVAIGLASLIHIFNPPCVVLGGGIMENNEIVCRIRNCTLSLLAPGFEHLELSPAVLGNQAGLLGAAYLTMQEISKTGN